MVDLTSVTDKEACSFLASRIRSVRLEKGYSQAAMAQKSGIALRTYKRIELTGNGSIKNLIIILRTLERIRAVEILFPLPANKAGLTIIERVQMIAEADQKERS